MIEMASNEIERKIFKMDYRFLIVLLSVTSIARAANRWHPCVEVKRDLRVPCECAITVSGLNRTTLALEINCDHMVLDENILLNLQNQPITSFSQKYCGHQDLPNDLIRILPDTLESLDLSDNAVHRLMDRKLSGRRNLRELRLANNELGDNLNPIFSSNEFHDLVNLKVLDLRSNKLRSLEEGIFKGCSSLEELYLDYNDLIIPPVDSLKGPKALRVLSLAGNNIGAIRSGVFSPLGHTLLHLDLSDNGLVHVDDNALNGLTNLLFLNISNNELHHLNSDVFRGVHNLQRVDMSTNFLEEFPTEALRYQINLRYLNMSNNLITELHQSHLTNLRNLQVLDLSRNNIGRLGVNVFTALTSLIRLDLSLNSLRAIEESAFEGLTNLQWLSLQDNNILLVPSAALARLPSLLYLQLDSNRITALSKEIFQATAARMTTLSLTRNLVRDLPPRLFSQFDRLLSIELSGNMISSISQQNFLGVEDTLIHVDLSDNRLNSIGELALRNLESLNLAGNMLRKISSETFRHLDHLLYLNISNNPLYGGFPPIFPRSLISLDVARTGLEVFPPILLLNLQSLERVSFSGNRLGALEKGSFKNLYNLTEIDLSYNEIEDIKNEAFVGLVKLKDLNLSHNKLKVFGGECFNTGTGLESLDLSNNEIEYLSPTTFLIHPRLRNINLAANNFVTFSNELIKTIQFLHYLDLSKNQLTSIGEFAFAQVPRLRELNLSGNKIQVIEELAFHNSTQLKKLDLSKNSLENLSERMMEGILRMEELNLMDNRLTYLPEKMLEASKVRRLEKINLSGNRLGEIPIGPLSKQASYLISLSIARNRLSEIFSQDIVNTVKHLDLSKNPLSKNAIRGILGEAKVLRTLNMSSCGVDEMKMLEAPFLRQLDLSNNNLEDIGQQALRRTTLLEDLNVSRNKIKSFDTIRNAFISQASLKRLDVSYNDINSINQSSIVGFENLQELKMSNLDNCTRIEKSAFKSLIKLKSFSAFNYPKLGYFDIQGIVKEMKNLETLDVEIKDLNVGNEQLSVKLHPRLKVLSLNGDRIHNVLSSLLVGTRVPHLSLGLRNTSIDNIPATLFFPVPRSTRVDLDVTGSKINNISPQLISALEERVGAVKIKGLKIQTKCDCKSTHLWKWCRSTACHRDNAITCTSPKAFVNQSIVTLSERQLSCESEKSETIRMEEVEPTTRSTWRSTNSEPEIIWTVASATQDPRITKQPNDENLLNSSMGIPSNTEDTLILGVVGGVVAFIAIVIMIICICRLRGSGNMNQVQMQAVPPNIYEASMLRPVSNCSGKMNRDIYMNSYDSTLGNSNNGTMLPPMKMVPVVQPLPFMQSSSNMQPIYGYYDNSMAPIYLTTSSENKSER